MPHKQNNPGCPCCVCFIASASFASGVDWTLSGKSSIASNQLTITGAGDSAIFTTPHPQYPYPPRIIARVKGTADSEVRVLLSQSVSDSLIVELRPGDGCGFLYLYQESTGLLAGAYYIPGAAVDQWHWIYACYDPRNGSFTANVRTYDGRFTEVSTTVPSHTYGEYTGFETGPTHSGTMYANKLEFWRLWYYGDGDQDDWDAYYFSDPITECETCQSDNCAYIDADFDDADSICEWTGATSDWTIAGSALGTDGSGADNSIILHRAAYTRDYRTDPLRGNYLQIGTGTQNDYTFDVDHYHRVTLTITFTASYGSTFYGIICATDADNYTAVEVTVGDAASEYCGTVKLISVVSGVATDISDEHVVPYLLSGITHILQINYYDGYVVAQIGDRTFGYGIQMRAEATYGVYVGLGATGDNVTVTEFEAGCRQIIESCQLDSDTFDYDATQWRTCKWSKLSGTWPTRDANDQLVVDADVSLLFNNPAPVPYREAHRAVLTGAIAPGAQDNTTVSLIFGSDSSGTDYYQAELLFAAVGNTLTLYRVNSGTPTQLSQVATAIPYPFHLTACCAGAKVYAAVTSGGSTEADGYSYGGYCGITADVQVGHVSGDLLLVTFATYRIHAGLNNWDEFWLITCQGCGPLPACSMCSTGSISAQYQLTTVGFSPEHCTEICSEINQTVIADSSGPFPGPTCTAAYGHLPDPAIYCESAAYGVVASRSSSITYGLTFGTVPSGLLIRGSVAVNLSPSSSIVYNFERIVDQPYDCESMYLVELPLVSMQNNGVNAPLAGVYPDWPCWPGYDEWLAFFLGNDPGTDACKMYVSSL